MHEVSVLIPTFNSESTLSQCARSLRAAATKANCCVYIYVFDNCSTDGTVAIAKKLINEQVVSGCHLRDHNIGLGTFLQMAHWYENVHCKQLSWAPVLFMDSEDTVSDNFFCTLGECLSAASSTGASLIIPQYNLRSLSSFQFHNCIGTNSFFKNALLLSLMRRALACLLLPGATGFTSMVWGSCFVTRQPFKLLKAHTKRFILDPEIPGVAWENSLAASLLFSHEYIVSNATVYRGCSDDKYLAFPGSDSALASLIYNLHDGGAEILQCCKKYQLLPAELEAYLDRIIGLRLEYLNILRSS